MTTKHKLTHQYPRYQLPFKRLKWNCRESLGKTFMKLSIKSNEELYRILNWSEDETGFFMTANDCIQLIIHRDLANKYGWINATGLINPQREVAVATEIKEGL